MITILIIVTFVFAFGIDSSAHVKIPDFTPITDTDVNNPTTVYIIEESVPYLRNAGISVYEREYTDILQTKKEYYHSANDFVKTVYASRRAVDTYKSDTSIDYIIYLVRELEKYAMQYKEQHSTSYSVNDLVLGYLRCIHKGYTDSSTIYNAALGTAFKLLCNSYDKDFVNYVNETERSKYPLNKTIASFFAFMLHSDYKYDNYNTAYGEIFYVDPPLKENGQPDENQNKNFSMPMDLIHMFCVMDGFDYGYKNGYSQYQQVIGLVGDMQQACSYLQVNGINKSDFEEDVLSNEHSCMSYSDFMSDIDGINIGLSYLNARREEGKNKLSNSMAAYYKIVQEHEELRYQMFIKNLAYEGEHSSEMDYAYSNLTLDTGLNGFILLITKNLALGINFNDMYAIGILDYSNIILYHFLHTDGFPKVEYRQFIARGVIEYICERAGYLYEI